jgi:hypothetical protein
VRDSDSCNTSPDALNVRVRSIDANHESRPFPQTYHATSGVIQLLRDSQKNVWMLLHAGFVDRQLTRNGGSTTEALHRQAQTDYHP